VRAFVDTSALLALSRRQDQYHAAAIEIADRHLAAGGQYVASTLVLGEVYSHLLYLRGPEGARVALTHLLDDPAQEWVEVSAALVREARTRWLMRFSDQSFSLVDAVSFEIMRRRRVTHAFAFDHHFEVAGFELLAV
jgi:predicted nucleic acid-binding protein